MADFDAGTTSSGALLLGEREQQTAIIRRFAACHVDHRDPDLIEAWRRVPKAIAHHASRGRKWPQRFQVAPTLVIA